MNRMIGLGQVLGLFDHRFQTALEFSLHARADLEQTETECAPCHITQGWTARSSAEWQAMPLSVFAPILTPYEITT